MRTEWLGAALLALPLTASSASAQARVEVDEWWEAEQAVAPDAALFRGSIEDIELTDAAYDAYGRGGRGNRDARGGDDRYGREEDRDGWDRDGRDRDRYDDRDDRGDRDRYDRPGRVDARGRIEVRPGWNARVVVVAGHDRYDRDRYAYRPAWRPVDWRVSLHPRADRFGHGRLDARDLSRILGGRTVDRLDRHAARIGAHGPLVGRLLPGRRGGTVLQVRAGRTPVAELIAYGRDRHVDVVRLNVRRYDERWDRWD
ncbi:MAG: hypothetical protein R3E98_14300 [Gemmatimonadota bacterium]|nr:hypothetical protein [Gemmatimonadota bacterium]